MSFHTQLFTNKVYLESLKDVINAIILPWAIIF